MTFERRQHLSALLIVEPDGEIRVGLHGVDPEIFALIGTNPRPCEDVRTADLAGVKIDLFEAKP